MENKKQTASREVDIIAFSEWAGWNYIRHHGCWVGKYMDQRNKENWYSTEKLIEIFQSLKK